MSSQSDDDDHLFAALLDETLSHDETRRGLKAIQVAQVGSRESIVRDEVLRHHTSISAATAAYRHERDDARERREQVLGEMHPAELRLRGVVRLGVIVTSLALVASGVLAFTQRDVAYVALAFIPAFYAGFLPWSYEWLCNSQLRLTLGISDRERELERAQERHEEVLKTEITAAVRRAINARLRTLKTTFAVHDTEGLKELSNPQREVPTAATEQLFRLMTSLKGGSIGLSGPRGCGKTTLMHSFATGRSVLPSDRDPSASAPQRERRGLVVGAPVGYDAREFVLHLYARVCERIIDPQGTAVSVPAADQLKSARAKTYARLLIAAAIVAAVAGTLLLTIGRALPAGPAETGYLALGGAVLSLYVGCILFISSDRERANRIGEWLTEHAPLLFGATKGSTPSVPRPKPETGAARRLQEIRFQQTLAYGWTGTLSVPLGSRLGTESKMSLARSAWTLPEVVDSFRDYIADLTKSYYLVIGIDEMDKMNSEEEAKKFLNNIKGVFGVAGCFYLVSVSEDAMSGFERRGLPFRDVFDSSFDALQRIDYLTLNGSRDVLESRVTGLPIPYQCLCHVLSGGLPRDLIRVARALVHAQSACQAIAMPHLCGTIVTTELRSKAVAAGVAARGAVGAHREWVLGWLQGQDVHGLSSDVLRERYDELAQSGMLTILGDTPAERQLHDVALETAVFGYYCATLLDFFSVASKLTGFLADGDQLSVNAGSALATLARARQRFALSPRLAWSDVSTFRSQVDWLEPWPELA